MACVTKRRGKWVIDYRDQLGRRHVEAVRGNRKQAEQFLTKRLHEIGRGEYQAPKEEKTFAELAEAYTRAHIDTNVRESTAKDYRTNLRLHLEPRFGRVKIRAITPEMVEYWRMWMLEHGIGRRTINKCHTLLGAMLRYAERHNWAARNVAAAVPKLREGREHDGDEPLEDNVLTPDEVRVLLKHADEPWRVLLHMAIATGLRQGELLGLQWCDIDWNSQQVHVRQQFSKGRFSELKTRRSRRRVPLTDDLIAELKCWRLACPKGERDLVFPHISGGPLDHGILLRSGFYPALRRAKLRRIRFHDLRHTFASLLIAANVHPKRMQALMGHSTIRTTLDTYGHLMRDHDDHTAEKLAALISGNKVVTTKGSKQTQAPQVLE